MLTRRIEVPDPKMIGTEAWQTELVKQLQSVFDDIYHDLQMGNANHKIYNSAPTIGEIGEGEIILSITGSVAKLHTAINGETYYINLTKG